MNSETTDHARSFKPSIIPHHNSPSAPRGHAGCSSRQGQPSPSRRLGTYECSIVSVRGGPVKTADGVSPAFRADSDQEALLQGIVETHCQVVIQAAKPEPRIMRYELTDHEWAAIRLMLPDKPRGVPRVDDRRVLNCIFWVLRSRAPWRDLPPEFGPYATCYNRFVRKRWASVWSRAAPLAVIVKLVQRPFRPALTGGAFLCAGADRILSAHADLRPRRRPGVSPSPSEPPDPAQSMDVVLCPGRAMTARSHDRVPFRS